MSARAQFSESYLTQNAVYDSATNHFFIGSEDVTWDLNISQKLSISDGDYDRERGNLEAYENDYLTEGGQIPAHDTLPAPTGSVSTVTNFLDGIAKEGFGGSGTVTANIKQGIGLLILLLLLVLLFPYLMKKQP
jgi:hypothetical protein